jgi:hypothetical protein
MFPLKVIEQPSEDIHLTDLVVDCVKKERMMFIAMPSR